MPAKNREKFPSNSPARAAFPSPRQEACSGLKLKYYPAYVRDLVDVDYADKLPEKERAWLAAFLEEYYRDWRLKAETQVHPEGMIRPDCSDYHRRRRAFAPMRRVVDQDQGDGLTETDMIDHLDTKRRVNGGQKDGA